MWVVFLFDCDVVCVVDVDECLVDCWVVEYVGVDWVYYVVCVGCEECDVFVYYCVVYGCIDIFEVYVVELCCMVV